MSSVEAVPAGYPRVAPYLTVEGAAAALDFYCEVLGATEKMRMPTPDGRVGHAELALGDSVIMLADRFNDDSPPTAKELGGTPVTLMVYVDDVDDVFARALKLGATEVSAVQDQFYGDRSGVFTDPFGFRWNVATHVEDVSDEEMGRRAAEAMGG